MKIALSPNADVAMNAFSATVNAEFHAEYDSVKFIIIFSMNFFKITIFDFGFEPKKMFSNRYIFYMEMILKDWGRRF